MFETVRIPPGSGNSNKSAHEKERLLDSSVAANLLVAPSESSTTSRLFAGTSGRQKASTAEDTPGLVDTLSVLLTYNTL